MRISDWSSDVCSSDLSPTPNLFSASFCQPPDFGIPNCFEELVPRPRQRGVLHHIAVRGVRVLSGGRADIASLVQQMQVRINWTKLEPFTFEVSDRKSVV